jgi:predicted Zn-dependent protease
MTRRGGALRGAVAVALAAILATSPAHAATQEQELGRRFFLEARSQLPLVEDPAVREYVERLGRTLVKTLGAQEFDYQFFAVASSQLNAFAVPGGYLFFFTGLIERAATDDEIVGVMGHEISHVHAHHIVRQQVAGQAWSAAALAGILLAAINPVLGAGAIAAAQAAQLKYSRDYEQEADFLGLRIAHDAGYDPEALGAFFKQLLVEQRLNPTGVPAYMLSHPVTEDRVAHVDSVIRSQKLDTPKGRPAKSPDFDEVRAVCAAIDNPAEVVIPRYEIPAKEKPNDPERQFLLGRVYMTVGKLEAARSALEKARDLGYGPRVDRPLGEVYLGLKAPEEARKCFERQLARRPDDAWTRLELGKALEDLGQQDAALKEYQRAVALDPSLDEAQRRIGLAMGRKGDQAEGFYRLAIAARERGDLEQAASMFARLEPMLPENSPRHAEVEQALDELEPLVADRVRERSRSRRRGVTGP